MNDDRVAGNLVKQDIRIRGQDEPPDGVVVRPRPYQGLLRQQINDAFDASLNAASAARRVALNRV